MPLYSRDAIRTIWFTSDRASWWRLSRWCLQHVAVLWLVTRFIETNLFAHIVVCLGVVICAEVRLHHIRSVDYLETFGLGSWQGLRALHERLDDLHPPEERQRADSDAEIQARPFEPGASARWAERDADPLEPYGTDLVEAAARPRHWGTRFLHREIGNLRKAQRVAGIVHRKRGLPTREVEDGLGTAVFYRALASLALLWAMVVDTTELASRTFHAGILLGTFLVLALALELAETVAHRRSERPLLEEARNCGIEAAIARIRNDKKWSIWRVHGTASCPGVLRLQLDGTSVTIFREEQLLFKGRLNRSRSRLREIVLFSAGDWVTLLTQGELQCVEEER